MGRMLTRAIEREGLREVADRAMTGRGLSEADLARLRGADLLVVAGLADAVRAKHRGDEVRVLTPASAQRATDVLRLELDAGRAESPTGEELLRHVALTRLATPCDRGLAVNLDVIGLELAQAALIFGADVIYGDLGSKRTLPLLDGAPARRVELQGRIERAGRRVRFADEVVATAEERP